jgi:hypothetical protein
MLLRSDGDDWHLTDGNARYDLWSMEVNCNACTPAVPRVDGEEVEVVLSLSGSTIGGLRGRRDVVV